MTISCDNCGKPFDWEPWPGLVHEMFHYCGRAECNAEMKARAVANEIWPEHGLRSQGAGAAASRILTRLQKEGLVEWSSSDHDWGWRISSAGRGKVARAA